MNTNRDASSFLQKQISRAIYTDKNSTTNAYSAGRIGVNRPQTSDYSMISPYSPTIGFQPTAPWYYRPAPPTATVPAPPTTVTAIAGDGQVTLSFTPPVSDGGSPITGYTINVYIGEGVLPSVAIGPSTTTLIISGLNNGGQYVFTVIAKNAVGNSVESIPSAIVTPITVPSAPTMLNAVAGDSQVTVSFTAPASNGGSPIIKYYIYMYINPEDEEPYVYDADLSLSYTVSELSNDRSYYFAAVAENIVGFSVVSNMSGPVTPITVPDAPTILNVVAGNGQVTLTFTAPTDNGGSPITKYTVTSSPGGITADGSVSPITVLGLTNGTPYTFTVIATNAAGPGEASTASNAVTPIALVANIVAFTEVGATTWTAPPGVTEIEYLVVGGGGGGGGTYSNIKVLGDIPFTVSDPVPGTANTYYIWDKSGTQESTNATIGHGYLRKDSVNNNEAIYIQATAPKEIVPNFGRTSGSGYPNNVGEAERWKPTQLVYFFNQSAFGGATNAAWSPGNVMSSTYNNNISPGSGGGGGGHIRTTAVGVTPKYQVTPGQTYNIYVGAGGVGGTATSGTGTGTPAGNGTEINGLSGESSYFDTIVALGGDGGKKSREGYNTNGGGGGTTATLLGGRGGAGGGRNGGSVINSAGYTPTAPLQGAPGASGLSINFDGSGNKVYCAGGDGGDPNVAATSTPLLNVGKGGEGTGAELNSFANGRDGGSGIVMIKYYTVDSVKEERIVQFTTVGSGSWDAPADVTEVEYLVVGGGGGSGGGFDTGGGGGGGGGMVLTETTSVTPGSSYTIQVGAGGSAGTSIRSPVSETFGGNGGDSVFNTITALGGSGGYSSRTAPGGGSLGGPAASNPSTRSTGGNGGGSAGDGNGAGGGGGGASGNGLAGVSNVGGNGGAGISSSITGSSITYSVGGRGANGASNNAGTPGAANTGNGARGGGAASSSDEDGAAGGSGIVILKYMSAFAPN
jgi:hypothetical protein